MLADIWKKHKIIIIGSLSAIVLVYFSIGLLLDWDVNRKTRQTIEAEQAANLAQSSLEKLQEENARIKASLENREIERAEEQSRLLEAVAQAKDAAEAARAAQQNAAQAVRATRFNRETQLNAIPTQSDTVLQDATTALATQLYPDVQGPVISARADQWFEINRSAAEIFNAALVETRSLRSEIAGLSDIIEKQSEQIEAAGNSLEAQGKQITNLELSITDHKERLVSLDNTLTASQDSAKRYEELARRAQTELRSHKRRAKFKRVRNIVITGAALAGAYYAGTALVHN